MTKPMYCPMFFGNSEAPTKGSRVDDDRYKVVAAIECTPDCAWAVKGAVDDNYSCAVAVIARKDTYLDINFRPLKDDAE